MTFKTRLLDSLRKISASDSDLTEQEAADIQNDHAQPDENSQDTLTYDQHIHITKDTQREFEDTRHERLNLEDQTIKEARQRIEAENKARVAAEARARVEAIARATAENRIQAEAEATEQARMRAKAEALAEKEAKRLKRKDNKNIRINT